MTPNNLMIPDTNTKNEKPSPTQSGGGANSSDLFAKLKVIRSYAEDHYKQWRKSEDLYDQSMDDARAVNDRLLNIHYPKLMTAKKEVEAVYEEYLKKKQAYNILAYDHKSEIGEPLIMPTLNI